MVLKTKGSASFFTQDEGEIQPSPPGGRWHDGCGRSFSRNTPHQGLSTEKADAADGTGSEDQIQLFRALSTALFRSAVHSLEAITMTTRSPLEEMMAFSTLLCACANSA